jgi:hypothetical protein
MRLLITLKSTNILLVFFLMLAVTTINAKIDPTDNNRNPGKEQVHDAPSEQNVNNKATSSNDEIVEEDEGALEEEEVSQSTNSFNYFFYLIYKIKFADIFDLPNRKSLTRSALPSVNLNALLEKLSQTEI